MAQQTAKKIKYEGEITLAGYNIPCYVLEDYTRILSGRQLQKALKIVDDKEETAGERGYLCH
jgi:hypothetical protein